MMARFGMIIDLQACVGCAACDIACKTQNNTPVGIDWSFHTIEISGEFPHVNYTYTPKLCNHCEDAPCVKACPTGAMYIDESVGITMHDADTCIGCKACMLADPYDVIYFNDDVPHAYTRDESSMIPNGTASYAQIERKLGVPYGSVNVERGHDYSVLRPKGIVEKCNFCSHKTLYGHLPSCVEACPADARIFGDLDDDQSQIVRLLKQHKHEVLLEEKNTKPKVFYIKEYQKRSSDV